MAGKTVRTKILYQVRESVNAIEDCKEHIGMALKISEGHNSVIIAHYRFLMDMLNGVDIVLKKFLKEVQQE